MGFSLRSRKTASAASSTTTSSATTSTHSSPVSSRTNSTTQLSELSTAPTTTSSKASLKLSKSSTSSSTSSFKSMIRSMSGRDSMDPLKYAPKKFKFRQADPRYVSMLGAWDMAENWGATERRCSWQSGIGPCDARRNSVCYAEQIEDVEEAR